jgi:Paraquat-inducible protein A
VQDPVDDPDLGGRDLGLNVMVRSFLLDNSGSIDFDLKDIQFGAADFELSFDTLRIKGLDTMTKLDLLQGIGPQTVRNELEMKNLRVEIDMIMKSGGNNLKLTVHMELEDIAAAVSMLLAMDIDALGELELGQVIDTSRIFKCVLSALPAFSLPELSFSVGKIVSFGVEGFEDTALAATVTEMTQLIFNDYNETFSSSFAPFMENTVKTILNNWFDYLLKQEANVVCPKFSREMVTEPTFLDFRDLLLSQAKAVEYGATGTQPYGDLIRSVVNIVKENLLDVDPVTGLASINTAVVRKLTESQSGVPGRLAFPGNLFDQSGRIQMGGLDASFTFRAFDAYIENVDTIGAPLSIVDPIMESRSELNNTASFGIGRPLQAGLRFFISIGGNGEAIKNDLDMSLDLDTATVILTALLKISEGAFFSYPLKDLTNTDCLLMMMPAPQLDARGVRVEGHARTAGLAELLVSVTKMNLNIKCLDCSGPAMAELEDLLSTPEASDATTATVNDIFGFATKMIGGAFMQVQVDRMLNEARLKCPSSPDYDPSFVAASYESFESPEQEDSIQFLVMLAIAMGIIILTVLVVTLVVKLVVRRRHRKWLDTASESKVMLLYDRQTKEQEKQAELNIISKSMFTSPEVPLWVRVLMPFIILGNIAFFLSGHLSLAATVNVQAQLGGQAILFDNFFEFSMITSTVEIWNAGGKPLAILIVIFSVIWPYTKQSITMGLWFAPPRLISISCRQSILLWLDILGKWSMIDILTLIVTIAGFRVSIQSPDVGFLPDNLYSIDLFVAPLWVSRFFWHSTQRDTLLWNLH